MNRTAALRCKSFAEHMSEWYEGFQQHWQDSEEAMDQVADYVTEVGQATLRAIPQKKKKAKPASDK